MKTQKTKGELLDAIEAQSERLMTFVDGERNGKEDFSYHYVQFLIDVLNTLEELKEEICKKSL